MSIQDTPHLLPLFSLGNKYHDDRERKEIEVARGWLQSCLGTHQACWKRQVWSQNLHSKTQPEWTGPSRLIKITVDWASDAIRSIHLISSQEASNILEGRARLEYITLSHCWGGADIVKLKSTNLAQFLRVISLEWLPQTFLDAIRITALLGFEYLWIDSLCIIQDSEEDWNQQSGMMGTIYQSAVITIAAVGATDSHGGCFSNEPAVSYDFDGPKASLLRIYATENSERRQPLHDRAWVMQERCLALRTLNFGTGQISWDCMTARACFSSPNMLPNTYALSLKLRFDDVVNSGMIEELIQQRIQNWWYLIYTYTNCKLTFATDRWVAIQGLAKVVQRAWTHTLLYGLWLHCLPLELLWSALEPANERLNIGTPTWSWLSINGTVRRPNHYDNIRSYAHITLPHAAPEPTTRVTWNGIENEAPHNLLITAYMARMIIMHTNRNSHIFRFEGVAPSEDRHYQSHSDGRCYLDIEREMNWDTWALQIIHSAAGVCAGLVVVPEGTREGVWKRVGHYDTGALNHIETPVDPSREYYGVRTEVTVV